jgi:peptide/nickel transport system substrate-binding protein
MTLDRKAFIDIISEGEDKAAGIMPPPDGGWA